MINGTDEEREDDKSSSSENGEPSDDKPPGGGQTKPTIEEGPSGITVEGNWKEVTKTCTDFTSKLKETYPNESFQDKWINEWVDWYPREEDDREELEEKTAEQAKYEAKQSPEEHLKQSTTKLASFREHFQECNLPEAMTNLGLASKKGVQAFFTFLGRSVASLEELIYLKIVVRTNPLYFDNSLLSASIRETNRFAAAEGDTYQLTIKVHDRELKDDLHRYVLSEN